MAFIPVIRCGAVDSLVDSFEKEGKRQYSIEEAKYRAMTQVPAHPQSFL